MTQSNHYQVLGVRPDASGPEIRTAFVRLTRLYHPDSADARRDLPQRLQEVQAAYRCLSVAATRVEHDALLAERERAHFSRARAVQRRLNHYDRRHPRAQPRPYQRSPWRAIALVALGIGALVSLRLVG